MRAISLLSGGKDSFLSALFAMDQGMDVVLSITVKPEEYSEMFHFPNVDISSYVSSLLGIKNIQIEEDKFYTQVPEIAREYDAKVLVSGAIASNFQKTRIERMCTENRLISYTPLWMVDQIREVREVISSRIKAALVSVSAEGLGEDMLGKVIDEVLLEKLTGLWQRYKINISGEGGEYESLVMGWFRNSIPVERFEKIWNGTSGYLRFHD